MTRTRTESSENSLRYLCLRAGARLLDTDDTDSGVLQLSDDRRVLLNQVALQVLSRCNGTCTAAQIADDLPNAKDEVHAFIQAAMDLGWIDSVDSR